MVEEVFNGTLLQVPWVSPFERGREIFWIDECRRLISNCCKWDLATMAIVS
jgi:hypothetical protein